MAGSKCAFNTATALRRVFMPSSLGTSDCLHVTRIFVPALLAPSTQHARTYWDGRRSSAGTWGSTNPYTSPFRSPPADAVGRPDPPPNRRRPVDENRPGPRVKTKLGRLPRDEEIYQRYVYVKGGQEDGYGGLGEPQEVKSLLATLDRKTESLQVTYMPNLEDEDAPRWPIAKIVNKKEEHQRLQLEKEERKRAAASSKEKELEINWTSTAHDLEHKIKKLQGFLAKGWKVQVVLLKKRKAKTQPKEKDAEALVERIAEATTEVKGCKEWKGREGKLLGSMRLFLQGKLQEKSKDGAENPDEATESEAEANEQSS